MVELHRDLPALFQRFFDGGKNGERPSTTPWNRKHVGHTMRPRVARGRRGSIEIFLVRGIATRSISLPGPFRERDTNFLSLERRVYRWRAWRGMPRVRAPIGAREASLSGGKRPRGASLPTRTQFTGPQSELIAAKKSAWSAVSWISRRC